MLRLLRRRYLQGSENLKGDGSFNLPLSGYKALVNKSSGEIFILEEKSGRAVSLVCASSGLWSIVPSALVTSYLAAKLELERFMTSGILKGVSNETLAEITTVANHYTNSFFLNVVEEPVWTDNNEIFLFPILFWYRLTSIIQFKNSKTTLVNGLYNLYAEKINEEKGEKMSEQVRVTYAQKKLLDLLQKKN